MGRLSGLWSAVGTMALWQGTRSVRRLANLAAVIVLVYATALAVSWVRSLFPEPRDGVIVGRTRVVQNVEIREVVKWRERLVPCVDLAEIVPEGAPVAGFQPHSPDGDKPSPTRDERKAEKEREKLEDLFAGKVDLGTEHLLRTLDVGGSRWGWKIAATIPKAAELNADGTPKPRQVELTAAETKPPLFGTGKRSEWWIGAGAIYRDAGFSPVVGGGYSTEAFTVKRALGTVRLFGGVDSEGRPVATGFFAIGGERWRGRE